MTLAHFIPLHVTSLVALLPRYEYGGRVSRCAVDDRAGVTALATSGGIEPGRLSRSVRRRAAYNRTLGAGAAGDTSSSLSRVAPDTRAGYSSQSTTQYQVVAFCTTRREVSQEASLRVVVLCDKPTKPSRTIDNLAWHVRCSIARSCFAVTSVVRR
jgi:hypothetical protein